MAKKTIKIKLNQDSINKAIDELRTYKDSLESKNEAFVNELAKLGMEVVRTTMSEVDLGHDNWDYSIEDIHEQTGLVTKMRVLLSGHRILFIEFGSGVTYSSPQNPKAKEMGMGVGTYPNQTHAWDMTGWFYTGDDGESHHTFGNRAYMPLYKSSVKMHQQIVSVARKVYR